MATTGNITELGLVDLIQMACLERYTARLTVDRESEHAVIFFARGEVVHAQTDTKKGPEALYEALSWTQGRFRLDQGIESAERTVHGAWTAHVLEALVRLDHERQRTGRDADPERQPVAAVAAVAGLDAARETERELQLTSPSKRPPLENPFPERSSVALPVGNGSGQESWPNALRRIAGVRSVVLACSDGRVHSEAESDQDEEGSALTAFLGNGAQRIGSTLNLGNFVRAQARIANTTRLVLLSDDCYVGLELEADASAQKVVAEARRLIRVRTR